MYTYRSDDILNSQKYSIKYTMKLQNFFSINIRLLYKPTIIKLKKRRNNRKKKLNGYLNQLERRHYGFFRLSWHSEIWRGKKEKIKIMPTHNIWCKRIKEGRIFHWHVILFIQQGFFHSGNFLQEPRGLTQIMTVFQRTIALLYL